MSSGPELGFVALERLGPKGIVALIDTMLGCGTSRRDHVGDVSSTALLTSPEQSPAPALRRRGIHACWRWTSRTTGPPVRAGHARRHRHRRDREWLL